MLDIEDVDGISICHDDLEERAIKERKDESSLLPSEKKMMAVLRKWN